MSDEDNLELLKEAKTRLHLSTEEAKDFASVFIGALSNHVTTGVWRSALQIAIDFTRSQRWIAGERK